MRFSRTFVAALAVVVVLAHSSPGAAQYPGQPAASPGMGDSFRIDFGGFFQKFDTSLYLESSSGASTNVSLEDMLGQDVHKTSFRVEALWRLGRHTGILLGYLGWTRSASATLSRDIQWGDNVIHAGAAVDSRLRVAVPQLYFAYSAVNNPTMDLGTVLGFSTYVNKFSLDASGTVSGSGGTTSSTFSSDQWHITVPVPATGAYLKYALYPGVILEASVKWLPTMTISGYNGGMLEYRAGLDFYFTKNFGIGGVYQYTHIHVYRVQTNTVGFDFRYSGPYGYLSLVF